MISPDYAKLVDLLVDRTRRGEVNWKPMSSTGDYVVYFETFSLTVGTGFDSHEQEEWIIFKLRSDTGKEIDRFLVGEHENSFSTVAELFALARRKAHRIDEALVVIVKELEDSKPVGKEDPKDTSDDDLPF